MSPAPQDSVICKGSGKDRCFGSVNLAGECVRASKVEQRPGARGFYCVQHATEYRLYQEELAGQRRIHWEKSHQRCAMDGARMGNREPIARTIPGPDPITLEFCSERCAARWDRLERERGEA